MGNGIPFERASPRTGWTFAAIDIVLAEVTEEFGGEDPLLPELRAVLERAKATLEDLRSSMASTTGEETEMPEPDEKAIARVRALVYRELNTLTLNI